MVEFEAITVPGAVQKFLDAMQHQTDIVTVLSTGGIGTVIFVWARILGIHNDADFSRFKRARLLIAPLCCFVIAIIVSYLIKSIITGFYYETALGIVIDKCTISNCPKITNVSDHLKSDYWDLQYWGITHLILNIIGVILLVSWFVYNVIFNLKVSKNGEHK